MTLNMDMCAAVAGDAYRLIRRHAGNFCGCGMNEMAGNDSGIEGIVVMVSRSCITSHCCV